MHLSIATRQTNETIEGARMSTARDPDWLADAIVQCERQRRS